VLSGEALCCSRGPPPLQPERWDPGRVLKPAGVLPSAAAPFRAVCLAQQLPSGASQTIQMRPSATPSESIQLIWPWGAPQTPTKSATGRQ
jgi:hypothetical protein